VSSTYLVRPGYTVTNSLLGALDADGTYNLTAGASSDPTFLRECVGDNDTTALQFSISAPPVVTYFVSVPSLSLRWKPHPDLSPLTLQFATNFAPGSWTTVNAVPVTNGDNVVVTLPITVNPMYFRLRP
jgi:hypothetical protein